MRELVFAEGDSIQPEMLQEMVRLSRQNLLNTQLFNFVDYEIDLSGAHAAIIHFSLVERWYTWPIPIFEIQERNLNDWIATPSTSKLNYGVMFHIGNFSGRNERLTLQLKAGYRHTYSLAYQSPYFNHAQNISWGVEAGIEMSRESAYLTEKNRQLFYKDNHFVFRKHYGQGSLTFRPGLYTRHRIYVGFHQYNYSDTLTTLNPRFAPGNRSDFYFINIGYDYSYDKRDARAYPLNGILLNASAKRLGIGFLEMERMDVSFLQASFRHYKTLAPRWFAAAGANLKWSNGSTLAYFNQQGLGFASNLVRGYENYVIDAQSFVVLKSNLKYALIPQKNARLDFIRTEKFSRIHYALYLNVFADAGYASDKYFHHLNPLNNKMLAGAGVGLDFVTYYDKVFRLECAVNRHGQSGVFFHMLAPF